MRFLIVALLSIMCLGGVDASFTGVTDLSCEYLHNPLGIDARHPRLSWVMESSQRGDYQTAYRILVATNDDLLKAGKGNLWDSGKVASGQSVHVPYGGRELSSEMRCCWKVMVWDKDGKPSAWSKPAFWTMGLLHPEDWKAKWIAYDSVLTRNEPLKDACWIWYPEGDPKVEIPAGTRYFRGEFFVTPESPASSIRLWITADNSTVVYVNGKKIGETNDWSAAGEFDLADYLIDGKNVIAVAATNESKGPAGLIGAVEAESAKGKQTWLVTSDKWKSSNVEVKGWMNPDFDDSGWVYARDAGAAGSNPWGTPAAGVTQKTPSPLFRKAFTLSKPVKRATAYICGLGYYELHLNGKKVGDHVLDPGFTRYDKRALYVTYDVTDMLRTGKNALGVMLGNGWYNTHANDVWDFQKAPWRNTPRLLFQMQIVYADGGSQVIVSDGSWKASTGPVVFDGIRNGETYDARLEKRGWDKPEYADSGWKATEVVEGPEGALTAQMMLPNRIVKLIKPVKVTESKPGVFIFDMGQNMSGWVRLKTSGPAGTAITLKYDERLNDKGLPDGRLANLVKSGKFQTDTYILKGQGTEVWEPRFVYHGFQYVQVEGFPGKPTLDSIEARVVHTDFEQMGKFECSNDLLNKIQRNTQWSYVSNFVGYPTDCPHREKNGWTGDAHLASETGLFNFNPMANYTKWMNDFADVQNDAGELPGIVPTGGWGYGMGPAWDSAYILIPWYMYLYCGDERVLDEHYDGFKRYVDFLISRANNGIVSFGLGDWCPPNGGAQGHKCPLELTSTAYYYVDALTVSKVAAILGNAEDAEKYAALAESIKKAFNDRFYDTARTTYTGDCQTSLATAVYQGLVQPSDKDKVIANLLNRIDQAGGHLDCGILGTKYIMHVLTDNGRSDVAYRIATQKTFPSWGYCIEQGATTLWETWDGEASRNHIMFGDISAWFYEALAGINPDPAKPGFKHVIIHPHPVGDLKWAKAEHKSMYGWIRSSWKVDSGKFKLDVQIPANTTATVYVPASSAGSVTEGDMPVVSAKGVEFLHMDDGCAVFEVGSGAYQFSVR